MRLHSCPRNMSTRPSRCNYWAGFLIVLLVVFSAFSVQAFQDGTITRLFGSKNRVAFTGHHPRSASLATEDVGMNSIPEHYQVRLKVKDPEDSELGAAQRIATSRRRESEPTKANESQISRLQQPPRIIIIGGPASGKGTQCEYIARKCGVVHLSTGDILREAVRNGSQLGIMAKSFMDRGDLVPDNVMIQIVSERLNQDDCQTRGWLLDGFPRTRAQAEFLENTGVEADVVLLLDVPDIMMIERVVGRRLDPITGKIYHVTFRPPPAKIRLRMEQRTDDTIEKIKQRLEQFHSNLSEIRLYFGERIVKVDGRGSPTDISKSIAHVIDQHRLENRRVQA